MIDDDLLIECVRSRKLLYDTSDPYYLDLTTKTQMWYDIGHTMKQEPDKCKTRWESLRNQFRRQVRRMKSFPSAASMPLPKWKHSDTLMFLLPYMRDKSQYMSLEAPTDDNLSYPVDVSVDVKLEKDDESPSPSASTSPVWNSYSNCSTKKTYEPADSASASEGKKGRKRKKKDDQSGDDMDLFFETMKATVRKFSESNKVLAKQRIFGIVTEMEVINLNEQKSISFNYSAQPSVSSVFSLNNSESNQHDNRLDDNVNNHSPVSPANSQQTTAGSYVDEASSEGNN